VKLTIWQIEDALSGKFDSVVVREEVDE